jgi:hypothetical protein
MIGVGREGIENPGKDSAGNRVDVLPDGEEKQKNSPQKTRWVWATFILTD